MERYLSDLTAAGAPEAVGVLRRMAEEPAELSVPWSQDTRHAIAGDLLRCSRFPG